ncbi:hypothetical protein FH972_005581 [Carpinus fangiana]|uniref:Glutaredoxin domain-containing protein n=1 Tax=Carpinus fangiana TaxID=176857 RepID=A0A5N6QRJ1_9ROSI|nr:hypothetical protein FH972_005581 [Carpinus fangiana]
MGMGDPLERIERLASENVVVIFSMIMCCMCHAIKRLFCGMGVNPTVYELDEDPKGKDMEKALMRLLGTFSAVPVVFIGGKLVGAMDRVMASHINGTLVDIPIQAQGLGGHDESVHVLVRLEQISDEIDGDEAGAAPHSSEIKGFNILPQFVTVD